MSNSDSKRSSRPLFKRRRFLVHSLQYRIIAANLIYSVAMVVAFLLIVFLPMVNTLNADQVDSATRSETASFFLGLHQRIWPAVLVLIFLQMIHSVVHSHRIGGPLYRLTKIFKQLGEGNLTETIRLRPHDYLHEEVQALNQVVQSFRAKVGQAAHINERIADLVDGLDGDEDSAAQQRSQIKSEVEQLQKTLQHFRLGS